MKLFTRVLVSILALMIFFSCTVSSASPYKTYTYSYDGDILDCPDGYVFDRNVTGQNLGISEMSSPNDVFCDIHQNIYIADTMNNRILCLDKNFNLILQIDGFKNSDGSLDGFNEPRGIYVTNDGIMYVADSLNKRIVVFKASTGEFIRVVSEPVSSLLKNYSYTPESIVVDNLGRMYVVSTSINVGVITLDKDGTFTGFLGAKRTTPSLSDILWRMFMTTEQKANSVKIIPSSYNNIAIDENGFLYLTTNSYEDWELQSYAYFRMTDDKFAPIRCLNATGLDVLKRRGFYPPMGDIKFSIGHGDEYGSSRIIDVAIGSNGIYSLLDMKRGKVFTYDSNGNLLYAFGGKGVQDGLTGNPSSICYKGNQILLLDSENGRLIVYDCTEYGTLLNDAIALSTQRKYKESIKKWNKISSLNKNNEMVFSAMGQDYLTSCDYKQAMYCFKQYKDISNYSDAYKQVRKDSLRVWGIPILLLVIAIIIGWGILSKKAKAYNKLGQNSNIKQTVWRQLVYSQHVIFHPFDGFYDIKTENRGSVVSATIIFVFTIISFIFKNLCIGFIFTDARNSSESGSLILKSIAVVALPVILWCSANWCLTTLMDGEGKFKDIYKTTCYSLIPLAVVNIPITILSNYLTLDEGVFITFAFAICLGWTILLLFTGMLTIHNYTLGKNIVMTIITIIGIAVIVFIALLFVNVIQKMLGFIMNLATEISFRM